MGLLSFVNKVCVQTAVYWEASGNDGYGRSWENPVDIKVRWDGVQKIEKDANGEEFQSEAEVLIESGRVIKVGDYLVLAALADYPSGEDLSNPVKVSNAYEVARVDTTPLFRKTDQFVRQVYLKVSTR